MLLYLDNKKSNGETLERSIVKTSDPSYIMRRRSIIKEVFNMYKIWKTTGCKNRLNIMVLERTADKQIITAWYESTNIKLSEEEIKEEIQ